MGVGGRAWGGGASNPPPDRRSVAYARVNNSGFYSLLISAYLLRLVFSLWVASPTGRRCVWGRVLVCRCCRRLSRSVWDPEGWRCFRRRCSASSGLARLSHLGSTGKSVDCSRVCGCSVRAEFTVARPPKASVILPLGLFLWIVLSGCLLGAAGTARNGIFLLGTHGT